MTILFVFFVLPLVTIILAIVLQKILGNPILVGITFFAIFLIVAFVAFSSNLAAAIIGAIILAIIAFVTAIIVQLICIIRNRVCNNNDRCCSCRRCCCRNNCNDNDSAQNNSDSGNLLRISCSCGNGESNDLLTINSNCNSNNDNDNNDSNDSGNSGCNNSRGGFVLSADVMSGNNNRRRCGCNRCNFRRF